MIIFPAIDLKNGMCVRLFKGDMEKVTVFSDNPSQQALVFEKSGFKWLHLVDLNGACEGKPVNIDAVESILKTVSIPVQLGGGIRDLATIERWLHAGITRVILGTVVLRDPELVKEACVRFPGQIVVGIDGRNGQVAVEGWVEESTISVLDLAKKFEDAGVSAIIYTDIERDGTLQGPDIAGTQALAKALTIPVIASGGMSSPQDLEDVSGLQGDGVCGVIIGRALYDGRITAQEALSLAV